MNIYQAIMKAADHIEKNPRLFNFRTTAYPDCNTPGCALGWIGHYLHLPKSQYVEKSFDGGGVSPVSRVLGVGDHMMFYDVMDTFGINDWRDNAASCARTLRLYAAKYHSDEKPVSRGIPADVLAIFEPTKVAA